MIEHGGQEFVTTAQAAEMLGDDVSPTTIRDWVRRGLLSPTGRVPGGSSLFRREDVIAAEYSTRATAQGRPRRGARYLPTTGSKGTISQQAVVMTAARVQLGRSRCTVVKATGRDCNAQVPQDAPATICLDHMRDSYLWFGDYLRGPYDPQAEAIADERAKSVAARAAAAAAAAGNDFEGLVYYLRFVDRIKIGHTTNLPRRLTAIPYDEVIAIEPGPLELEKMRHRQFGDARVVREWFEQSDELLSHINMLRDHYGVPHPKTGERLADN
ncbi:MAG TPA: helix-turn-helix domain-containing protein [Actinoplanes sp.]